MGNQQSQKPFSSSGHTLGGVPVGGTGVPQQQQQQQQQPAATAHHKAATTPVTMPGRGAQLDGGTGLTRAPLDQRLASASAGLGEADAARKAREAKDAAAKAAEARASKAAANANTKVAKQSSVNIPERVVVSLSLAKDRSSHSTNHHLGSTSSLVRGLLFRMIS